MKNFFLKKYNYLKKQIKYLGLLITSVILAGIVLREINKLEYFREINKNKKTNTMAIKMENLLKHIFIGLHHYKDGKRIRGKHSRIYNTWFIYGDCTNVCGDCQDIVGCVTGMDMKINRKEDAFLTKLKKMKNEISAV